MVCVSILIWVVRGAFQRCAQRMAERAGSFALGEIVSQCCRVSGWAIASAYTIVIAWIVCSGAAPNGQSYWIMDLALRVCVVGGEKRISGGSSHFGPQTAKWLRCRQPKLARTGLFVDASRWVGRCFLAYYGRHNSPLTQGYGAKRK